MVEATGGYERALVEACVAKVFPVLVVQPAQVRQFARARGISGKTDKMDAKLIACFRAVMQPEPRPAQSLKVMQVTDLLARKRLLTEARTQELNRQHKAPKHLTQSHSRLLKLIE